jgi:hypothetical protein
VKKLWKFHHFFQWKMSEKQMTFFTVNCAGKIESAVLSRHQKFSNSDDL